MNIAKRFLDGNFYPDELRYCFHTGAGHQQRQQATTDFGQQASLTNAAQGTASQFEGPVQNSPFYKSLLTTGIQNTSDAYQNAASNMKAKANAAGFGYQQPVAQGADNQLAAQETAALAQVPQQAMTAAAPLSLQAANQSGAMGTALGQQGVGLLNANAGQTTSLYNQLMQTGGQIASAAIGAACPAKGSLFLMADGTEKPVETLRVGEEIAGVHGEPETIEKIFRVKQPILRVVTENGTALRNSFTHCYILRDADFTLAIKSLGKEILTGAGFSRVVRVEPAGVAEVFSVETQGSHTYRADGAWALGVGDRASDEVCEEYLRERELVA